MSLIKKLAGETLVYGMGSVLPRILNFLLLAPYFTRILKESSYGIHGIMYSFSALLLVLFTYRMETAFFRFGSKRNDLISSFSTASFGVFASSLLLTLPLLFFSKPIASILTSSSDQIYVVYFAFIIFFDAVSALPFAKLRLQNRPVKFSMLKILNVLINAAIIIFLIELLPRLENAGFELFNGWYQEDKKLDYIFIANLVASSSIFLVIAYEYRDLQYSFNRPLFKKMLIYSLPLVVVGIAGVINQLIDRYLVKELLPGDLLSNLEQSGIYNACVKIAVLMLLFTTAFNYAAEPFFFKNADRSDAPKIYATVAQVFTLVASCAFLFITLFLDYFQLLIGENFREGLSIVPILLLAYLFLGLYYNFSIWYKLKDKTHYGAYIASVGSIITLALNFWLVPSMGYLGASVAALACFLTMSILALSIGRRFLPIPYPLFKMAFTLFSALAFYAVHFYTEDQFSGVIEKLLYNIFLFFTFVIIALMFQKEILREFNIKLF